MVETTVPLLPAPTSAVPVRFLMSKQVDPPLISWHDLITPDPQASPPYGPDDGACSSGDSGLSDRLSGSVAE